MPSEETAAHTPSAVARSRGSVNRERIIDSVVGMIIAPPTPSRARTAITAPAVSAASTSSDAPPKTANPLSSSFLRPHRSASLLIGISSPASTSE
ncbi:hypothetical protein SAMN05421805_11186 [Saccharopolyspora antimicrobica]|uniref:Uncharacterized protein n=1 Tax=Saccharopolyspora antimicrobica TaxID=455193 RepID=A0A1I5FIP5_9PSEU|nr:hypothetical protein ATL45_0414 [Saccharopolyspora antimicrobica]SFO23489.1 hypothetical protein SAMN05421805_11186 [Saccharopolyspora antimicrobica]